jgi:hypothetical protein
MDNFVTKYTIELDSSEKLSHQGKVVSELAVILQIWQDLNRLSIMGQQSGQELALEDTLIKKVLQQILIAEFGSCIPESYEPVKKQITEEEARAMGIQFPGEQTLTSEEVDEKHAEENPIYIPPKTIGEREDRHL